MSDYTRSYRYNKNLSFIVPIAIILFFGFVYLISQKSGNGFASYILVGASTVTIAYWIKVIKKMTINDRSRFTRIENDTKNWMFDLIKDNGEIVFVAEVPGPVDKITVRLIDSTLYIKSINNFSKNVLVEGAKNMKIHDFKYKNGVLTLRIKS
ncbi:MAG: Hsp20/alpha crystallin family protein [Thaumarchaeota archaeon]|nr:Hsp20/alpha crystallin family protein [Nitrososphaerota archaeon]